MLPGIQGIHPVIGASAAATTGPTAYPVLISAVAPANNASSPLLIPYPAVQADDIAIIQCILYDAAVANQITAPVGWTVMANEFMNGVNGVCHGVFLKRMTGSETGSVSITENGQFTGGNDTFQGMMSTWRGCKNTGNPYEGLINQTGSSTSMQGGAVTTTGDYRLLCHFGAVAGQNIKDSTPAAGYTEQWENDANSGFGKGTLFLDTKQILTATAEPAATHTLNATSRWQECAFALLPLNA